MSGRVGVGILAFSCGKVCGVEYLGRYVEYGQLCITERLFIPSVLCCIYCVCMSLLAHGSGGLTGTQRGYGRVAAS